MEFLTSFFIESAWAQTQGQAAQPDPLISFLPLLLIIVVFYFLLIRPQSKRQKEHRQMIEALGSGDEVVTGGGLLGKIKEVGEQYVTVEFADNVTMKVQKNTISAVLPKGTIKNA
ncbi:MAG TPA: preprotein translocase subunit YajC [Gammaproteobacteria bacterium]